MAEREAPTIEWPLNKKGDCEPMAEKEAPTIEWPLNKKGDCKRLLPLGPQEVKSSPVKSMQSF